MNHRTGRLTWRDFEPSESVPAPTFCADQVEVVSDFGVIQPGAHFNKPPPRRMWQEERDDPRLVRLYGWSFSAAIVASALLTRCS